MDFQFITVATKDAITYLTLNRPDKRNAMHGPMVLELQEVLSKIANSKSRVLIINTNSKDFCAGGDIAWMQQIALGTEAENTKDARSLADLLYQIYTFPQPTIVLAKGAILGGGLGILAAADIALSSEDAVFGLPEVKLGLVPAVISPYVLKAIGERQAHYYFLTGERFNAAHALQLGLIHQVHPENNLVDAGNKIAQTLLSAHSKTLSHAKNLIKEIANKNIDAHLAKYTAELLANLRSTKEAQEALKAFVDKK